MTRLNLLIPTSLSFLLALAAWGQANTPRVDSRSEPQERNSPAESTAVQKKERGAAKEVGAGVGTIGVGAAKGAGDVAKGTGRGALDLVTLHPINAAGSFGKGAVAAGKDVTVGTVKGSGKVGKGIGRAFKHLF